MLSFDCSVSVTVDFIQRVYEYIDDVSMVRVSPEIVIFLSVHSDLKSASGYNFLVTGQSGAFDGLNQLEILYVDVVPFASKIV